MLPLLFSCATPAADTIHEVFPPPDGFVRVDGGDFGAWLGRLSVAPADQPVRTHDGDIVPHDGARVVAVPMVSGDLQQCADMAIRLRAEWQRETGQTVLFHATSGDPMPWKRWQDGERPYVKGNNLAWRPGTKGGWDAYMKAVFTWAGTISLRHNDTVAASDPRPGDVVVTPGSPGHAVVLLDVATRGDAIRVLVGEGYMPAQDFHVEHGPHDGWWTWEPGLSQYHWPLPANALRRFK